MKNTSWKQRSIAIAVAFACFGGFFLVGRTITSDDPVDPSGSTARIDAGDQDELVVPTRLALAGRVPNLIAPKPRTEEPTNRAPESSAALPPAAPAPTEPAPDPAPVEAPGPPPATPEPPPEAEPAPEPEPPPGPKPDREPKPEPTEDSVAFESSG